MEKVKDRCTSYFLNMLPANSTAQSDSTRSNRSQDPIPNNIDQLVSKIDPCSVMEEKVRHWYGGSTDDLPRDDLFRILVRDSCFIIRIILAISRPVHESMFFRLGVDIKKVRFDMLLLENQIPFFFLLKVYAFFNNSGILTQIPAVNSAPNSVLCQNCPPILPTKQNPPQPNASSNILGQFYKELEPFIGLDMPWEFNNEYGQNEEPDHLLHLYWRCCLPFPWTDDGSYHCNQCGAMVPESSVPETWVNIHLRHNSFKRIKNAYELYWRAGVTFRKREHHDGFGVTFQKGTLKLPHLQLDQSQTKLLLNLIAFEEFKPSRVRVMTSYVLLLDGLINTEKDVELLQRYGVITNKLGSSQIASSYFNDIGNACSIDYDDHYCHEQFDALNRYCNSTWTHQFAKLRHNHVNSPWAVISLLAGSTLLIFSALQTYYTVYGYYHHH